MVDNFYGLPIYPAKNYCRKCLTSRKRATKPPAHKYVLKAKPLDVLEEVLRMLTLSAGG